MKLADTDSILYGVRLDIKIANKFYVNFRATGVCQLPQIRRFLMRVTIYVIIHTRRKDSGHSSISRCLSEQNAYWNYLTATSSVDSNLLSHIMSLSQWTFLSSPRFWPIFAERVTALREPRDCGVILRICPEKLYMWTSCCRLAPLRPLGITTPTLNIKKFYIPIEISQTDKPCTYTLEREPWPSIMQKCSVEGIRISLTSHQSMGNSYLILPESSNNENYWVYADQAMQNDGCLSCTEFYATLNYMTVCSRIVWPVGS